MIYFHSPRVALAVSVLVAATEPLAFAGHFLGQVVRVLDGNTIEIL